MILRMANSISDRLLAEELSEQSSEWSAKPSAGDIDELYIAAVISNTKFHRTILENLADIEALLNIEIDEKLQQQFLRGLYINVITAMETFISDAFINKVVGSKEILRKFVETNPDFKKEKLALSQIFCRMDDLEKEAKSYLADLCGTILPKSRRCISHTRN